jgi:hypothetical protein
VREIHYRALLTNSHKDSLPFRAERHYLGELTAVAQPKAGGETSAQQGPVTVTAAKAVAGGDEERFMSEWRDEWSQWNAKLRDMAEDSAHPTKAVEAKKDKKDKKKAKKDKSKSSSEGELKKKTKKKKGKKEGEDHKVAVGRATPVTAEEDDTKAAIKMRGEVIAPESLHALERSAEAFSDSLLGLLELFEDQDEVTDSRMLDRGTPEERFVVD